MKMGMKWVCNVCYLVEKQKPWGIFGGPNWILSKNLKKKKNQANNFFLKISIISLWKKKIVVLLKEYVRRIKRAQLLDSQKINRSLSFSVACILSFNFTYLMKFGSTILSLFNNSLKSCRPFSQSQCCLWTIHNCS